ncbi:hypothetical protein TSH7_10065 [Azospirillum sp. TSH7]|nr:hypothetical protein TSH20_19160 [Azospirillum sp. TSH20]PWC64891.1 hypothetical protein TSH7_10065 [Azospirillum sp. TSH7]
MEWEAICRSTELLLRNLPNHSLSAGAYYKDDPLMLHGNGPNTTELAQFGDDLVRDCIDTTRIWIEGTGPAGTDLGHESFVLNRTKDRAFCKTARKPYDLVVCAVLAVAQMVAPDAISVTSDGDSDDWWPAIEWASLTLDMVVFLPAGINRATRT